MELSMLKAFWNGPDLGIYIYPRSPKVSIRWSQRGWGPDLLKCKNGAKASMYPKFQAMDQDDPVSGPC